MYDPVESSTASSMEGISEPHGTKTLRFGRGGDEIAHGVRWYGGEYNGDDCWIKADMEDFEPVEP